MLLETLNLSQTLGMGQNRVGILAAVQGGECLAKDQEARWVLDQGQPGCFTKKRTKWVSGSMANYERVQNMCSICPTLSVMKAPILVYLLPHQGG